MYNNKEYIVIQGDLEKRFEEPKVVSEEVFLDTICTKKGIPHWVNLSVYRATPSATIMMADISTHQVSSTEEAMFGETAPFHTVSPTLPPIFKWGGRHCRVAYLAYFYKQTRWRRTPFIRCLEKGHVEPIRSCIL